jgi:hypothetical protein
MKKGDFCSEDLDRVYVSSLSGKQIPLKQFVDLELQQVPSSISRFDLERTAELLADVRSGIPLDEVMDPILARLEDYPMPEGYLHHRRRTGESDRSLRGNDQCRADCRDIHPGSAGLAVQVCETAPDRLCGHSLCIYRDDLGPADYREHLLLHCLCGTYQPGGNCSEQLHYSGGLYQQAQGKGKPLDRALQSAAEIRLTPIVLTALTTIGGLLPLTLRGGTIWAPMGWTIIGG